MSELDMASRSEFPTGMPSNFRTTLNIFEDAGDEPIFDVHDQLKPLVATKNEVKNGLAEPSQETKDIMAFEKELHAMTFPCKDCGADGHMTGLCKQRETVRNAQFMSSVDDLSAREKAARGRLSKGIPRDAPICPHHAKKAADDLKAGGMEHTKKFAVPGSTQGFLRKTALLPICWLDFIKKTGHQVGTAVPELDTCTCASAIVASDCWVCAVLRIEGTKTLLSTSRMKRKADGSTAITCECGDPDRDRPLVKQCAGCDGIVTLPTTNFMGDDLKFDDAGAEDPTAIVPKQPASLPHRPRTARRRTREPAKYKPVSQMRRESRHRVFTSAEISKLRGYGLDIAAPITDADFKAMRDPRLRLDALMRSIPTPAPLLDVNAVDGIVILCNFTIEQLMDISKTLKLFFDGEITADNLGVLVSMALDTQVEPKTDDVAWMDGFKASPFDKPKPEEDTQMGDA